MLIYIIDIRNIYDTFVIEFSDGYKAHIKIVMPIGGHRIDIEVGYIKEEAETHVVKFVSIIYNNIISGYIDTIANTQTFHSLLGEIGEYINYLKINNFGDLSPENNKFEL